MDAPYPTNILILKRVLQDVPLLTWVQYRAEYLDEFLTLEGRGRLADAEQCSDCGSAEPEFRCTDCHTRDLVCKACCLERHARLPLHRIEVSMP